MSFSRMSSERNRERERVEDLDVRHKFDESFLPVLDLRRFISFDLICFNNSLRGITESSHTCGPSRGRTLASPRNPVPPRLSHYSPFVSYTYLRCPPNSSLVL